MNKFFETVRKDRLYILLLIFIILINVLALLPAATKGKLASAKVRVEAKVSQEELFLKKEEVDKLFHEKRNLALIFSLTSLLALFVILLGIAIDIILISIKLAKKKFDIHTYRLQGVSWNLWDIAKVIILFLFFGYMIVMIESLVARFFPLIRNENFRMIWNTTILDILGVVFILYFTVGQYKEKLIALGISSKNFFKNVFYGIVGYIATVPLLVMLVIVTALVTNLIKYIPEKQPVVELFLKEKNVVFLTYTSLFAAVLGPIIEELFFRGFLYNAFKKYIGIFWAMVITASIFATLHSNVVGFLPIMILGLLLAYLYEKTGTLVSSITVHVIHNFSMVLFVFLARQLRA